MPLQIGYFDKLKNIAGKILTFSKTITLTSPDDTSVITLPAGAKTVPPTTDIIKGDGTAGRVLRCLLLIIENGTNATTIKPSTISIWNGNVNGAEDNLGKGGDTGNFALSAGGSGLTLQTSGISGDALAIIGAEIQHNSTGTIVYPYCTINAGGMVFTFKNNPSGADVDLTTLVDSGVIYLRVLYITTA